MATENGKVAKTGAGAPGYFGGTWLIVRRELGAIFDSSIAYIYFIAFTVLSVGIFMNEFFVRAVVDMTPYFKLLPLLLIVFIPALTMRVWAEEKRVETFELLMTLPFRSFQIVIGKFLAIYIFYLITLCGSLPVVVMLASIGSPDAGLIFSCYLGAALIGAVFVAFGVFTSGVTANQIVAFVLSVFIGFFLVFSGNDAVVRVLDGLSPGLQIGTFLYESISILPRFEALISGALSAADAFYFAAATALFLWMNETSVKGNRA